MWNQYTNYISSGMTDYFTLIVLFDSFVFAELFRVIQYELTESDFNLYVNAFLI